MHEDLNQKISELVDDELDGLEALNLLRKMHAETCIKERFNRYKAIGHVLKSEQFLLPDLDFSLKVSQQIQQEPVFLIPHVEQKSQLFKRSHKVMAVAASIAVAAIVASRGVDTPSAQNQASAVMQLPVTASASSVITTPQSEKYPVNKQINDYLQAHNSSVYTNGQVDIQPYTRVTAYSQK